MEVAEHGLILKDREAVRNYKQPQTATSRICRHTLQFYSSIYLEEGTAGLQGTCEVVGVSAAKAVTATCCSNLLTMGTAKRQSTPQS